MQATAVRGHEFMSAVLRSRRVYMKGSGGPGFRWDEDLADALEHRDGFDS
jgi:hypothetical protein